MVPIDALYWYEKLLEMQEEEENKKDEKDED